MEYEKHIKRLILGYLKNECKPTYKVFLKHNFQNSNRHIATRVAGQTLEDILEIYSRIQETIQGRLEDTNYYLEKDAEFSSPLYLVDQLNYLLEFQFSPDTTPCPSSSSPGELSITESHHGHTPVGPIAPIALIDPIVPIAPTTNIEATPEHLLPGNVSSSVEGDHQARPLRNSKSPINKTLEKMPTPDKEIISEAITKTMLENSKFQKELASTINTVLNTPGGPSQRNDDRYDKSQAEMNAQLDETISDVQRRIEGPIFEELFQEILDNAPLMDTMSRVVNANNEPSTSSNTMTHEAQLQTTSSSYTEGSNVNTTPSQPSTSINITQPVVNNPPCSSSNVPVVVTSTTTSATTTVSTSAPLTVVCSTPSTVASPQCDISNNQANLYMVPRATNIQPIFVVNQSVMIPQNSLIQVAQPCLKPVIVQTNSTKQTLQEQDIMSMPTIILNENNEVTYADPGSFSNTQMRNNEARNIQEYVSMYGVSDQSPILKVAKKKGKKTYKLPQIRPMPTVKVEIFNRNFPEIPAAFNSTKQIGPRIAPKKAPAKKQTELPNLNQTADNAPVPDEVPGVQNKNGGSQEANVAKSLPSILTPSPLVTAVKKPTPKSGSHVRNLAFPSPLKKTPTDKSKVDEVNSPRTISKQQATKDLFSDTDKKGTTALVETDKPNSPEKTDKTSNDILFPKTPTRPASGVQWDSALRIMAVSAIESASTATPVRPKQARRKRSTNSKDKDVTKTPSTTKRSPKRKHKNKNKKNVTPTKPIESKETEVVSSSDPKVLSPSKLNANKRNILPTEGDNITPDNIREPPPLHHPISAKRRRNINSLLETPIKEEVVTIPPTPGATIANTPLTPMLEANLQGYTVGGNMYSIDTPNFPTTPGFSIVSHTTDYYIPKANETDKATEAIVTLEEKKSSVRSTDTDCCEEDLTVKVYGTRDVLDNFNQSRIGKKNLELVEGVSWEANSDKEERSDAHSDSTEEESNNTVIQALVTTGTKRIKTILPKNRRISGKHMEVLKSQLLVEEKISSTTSDTLFDGGRTSQVGGIVQVSIPDDSLSNDDIPIAQLINHIRQPKENSVSKQQASQRSEGKASQGQSIKEQLEEKKQRIMQQEKYSLRRTAGRAAAHASKTPPPSTRSRRKAESPKKVIKDKGIATRSKRKSTLSDTSVEEAPKKDCIAELATNKNKDNVADDSQDEFFKKSGTNLHRKSKDSRRSSPEPASGEISAKGTTQQELSELTSEVKIEDQPEIRQLSQESPEKEDEEVKADNLTQYQMLSPKKEDEFEEFDMCAFYTETAVYEYDPKNPSQKRIEDYDFSNLRRTSQVNLPCSDGPDIPLLISVCPFATLLDIPSSLPDSLNDDQADDSSNPDESDGLRILKKRKRRSNSCGSNSSGKKANVQNLLNTDNIENLLTKLHGPTG